MVKMGNKSICSIIGWFPKHMNMEIIQQVTSYVTFTGSKILKKRHKSPSPALNVYRHEEPIAKDNMYSDVATIDRTGLVPRTWILVMPYVCSLLNHTYNGSIHTVPIMVATGSTPDISPLLQFTWWGPVYYKVDDSDFPSDRG
jgi:hypothetical protein